MVLSVALTAAGSTKVGLRPILISNFLNFSFDVPSLLFLYFFVRLDIDLFALLQSFSNIDAAIFVDSWPIIIEFICQLILLLSLQLDPLFSSQVHSILISCLDLILLELKSVRL